LTPLHRYILFQAPGWALAAVVAVSVWRWLGIDLWLAMAGVAIWVAKDFVLYPFVRGAYERKAETGAESLIGMTGVVQRRIAPRGLIRVRGELWRAELARGESTIETGETVRVSGARGLMLLVSRETAEKKHD